MSRLDPAELLPHRPPMLLLDAVRHDRNGRRVTAEAVVREEQPFVRSGWMRAAALLEHMAQAAAACRPEGEGGPVSGRVIAVPQARFHRPTVAAGERLTIVAERVAGNAECARFDAEVRAGDSVVATAVLTVYRRTT